MSAMEDFAQYQLRFVDDIQHDYEVIRPIVLFAETIAERSRQTGIEPTVVGAKARRFAMEGMLGLVDQRLVNPGRKGHIYPDAVAAHILYLKQLYPPIHDREIVRIVQRKIGCVPPFTRGVMRSCSGSRVEAACPGSPLIAILFVTYPRASLS